MIKAEIVSEKKFSQLLDEAEQISKILAASIKAIKDKNI
jgi:hypothetical protein